MTHRWQVNGMAQNAQPETKSQELEEKKPAGAGGGKSTVFRAHTRGHAQPPPPSAHSRGEWSRSTAPGVSLPEFECLFCHFLVVLSGLMSIELSFLSWKMGFITPAS